MKSIHIIEHNVHKDYLNLFQSIYINETNREYFVKDIEASLEYSLAEKKIRTIALIENKKLIGHCSLIYSESNPQTCQLGFFELVDARDFGLLWKEIVEQSRVLNIGIVTVFSNGSIWFPYRCIHSTSGLPLFKGELPTQEFYHGLFSSLASEDISYYSSMRSSFGNIMALTENFYNELIGSGLEILSEVSIGEDLIHEVYALSRDIFSQASLEYDELPFDYFIKLYDEEKLKHLFNLYTVRKGDQLVGFCSVFKEDSETLILKTLAVHPEFQKKNIGRGLTHLVHKDAIKHGYKNMMYALIRGDNDIRYFPTDDVKTVRTYSLFKITI
jgi:GNAT superfamily N-acetyltransferase